MTTTGVAAAEKSRDRGVSDLKLEEAIPLAAALVSATASRVGVRALLIKGPSLSEHGLREERVSADVDFLVDPSGFQRLSHGLAALGWLERAAAFRGQPDAPHARTLFHRDWPCDIDLHRFFPGLLADPSKCFEVLWAGRTMMALAHFEAYIPDALGSALIHRLALLRGGDDGEAADLDEWAKSLTESQSAELRALITNTGAGLALTSTTAGWESITMTLDAFSDQRVSERQRALTGEHGFVFWRVAFKEASPLERARALVAVLLNGRRADWRRAARGSARLLRSQEVEAADSGRDKVTLR